MAVGRFRAGGEKLVHPRTEVQRLQGYFMIPQCPEDRGQSERRAGPTRL